MVGPLCDLCECQVEFGNVLQRLVRQICDRLCEKGAYGAENKNVVFNLFLNNIELPLKCATACCHPTS